MRKFIICIPLCGLFGAPAFAAEDLKLNVRRIGLDLSETSVGNAQAYANSPVSQLHANGQEYLKGVSDVALEYVHDDFTWTNSVFAEYGRTEIKPAGAPKQVNESADQLLLSSDYAHKLWEWSGLKFGPMARVQYQTEFTENGAVPRQNLGRGLAGLKLFDHSVIKDLYAAGVYEYDWTYSDAKAGKTAAELGWRLEYELRSGVKLSTNGYYREYLGYSQYVGTDLERDLSATARMDVNLFNNLTMGPYVQYRRARSREAEVYASNLTLGLSFSYINLFDLGQ
jgi:hypothetical protein